MWPFYWYEARPVENKAYTYRVTKHRLFRAPQVRLAIWDGSRNSPDFNWVAANGDRSHRIAWGRPFGALLRALRADLGISAAEWVEEPTAKLIQERNR